MKIWKNQFNVYRAACADVLSACVQDMKDVARQPVAGWIDAGMFQNPDSVEKTQSLSAVRLMRPIAPESQCWKF
jgi:hypothetical protein